MDFDHPTWNYEEESVQLGQDFSPGAPGYCLDNSPLADTTHHAPVPSHYTPISESYHSPYEQMTIPLPYDPHPHHSQPSAHDTVPESALTDAGPPYDIPFTDQSDVHWVHETQPQAFPAYDPSGSSNSASLMTLYHPQNLPEQANGPLNAANGYYSQPEVGLGTLPPSTTLDDFGEHPSLPPTPHSTAGSANSLGSHAAYACQCVTDGLTCHDEVTGTVGAVRNHIKRIHKLNVSGKVPVMCPWTGCNRLMQAENLPRHIVTCHFRVKVRCTACGMLLSRRDVQYSHVNACPARRSRGSASGGASSSSSSSRRFEPFHRRALS